MSNLLLPRGLAAKRAAAAAAKSPDSSGGPDGMQIDHQPPSSVTEFSTSILPSSSPSSSSPNAHSSHSRQPQSIGPSGGGRWKDRDQTIGNARKFQRKPIKPLKPPEIALLVETAMSDYALWENANLRRYASDKNTSGYLALSRLLNESSIVAAAGATLSEVSILQALKDFGTGAVELQMKVTPAASGGSRFKYATSSAGSYNIRRVDWESLRYKTEPSSDSETSEAGGFWKRTQEDWERCTIYIENIPQSHWSLPGALVFVRSLIDDSNQRSEQANMMEGSITKCKIQNLELPAHAKAAEGDIPLCKGFAFVTFDTAKEAECVASRWPWHTIRQSQSAVQRADEDSDNDSDIGDELMNLDLSKEKNEHEIALKEATESGFRSITYHRWVELKNEYLARQEALYEAMRQGVTSAPTTSRAIQRPVDIASIQQAQNAARDREVPPHLTSATRRGANEAAKLTANATPIIPPARNSGAEYPQGCLLFVKNVHPQTNKTALKSLFGHILNVALGSTAPVVSTSAGQGAGNSKLDYVDWSKGMSSCHLRLTHPTIARALATYLGSHNLVQATGEDIIGTPITSSSKPNMSIGDADMTRPLVAELVQGRAEEIYWGKVPEKIKNVALGKLNRLEADMALTHGIDGARASPLEDDEETTVEDRMKKRRKKA